MLYKLSYISRIGLSLLALLAMIVPVGCSDDPDSGLTPDGDAGYVTLNLRNAKSASRAADDTRNEDLIKSAVVCLYPNGAVAATKPTYVEYFPDLEKNGQASVRTKLSKTLATALFGTGNGTCTAYVIVNLPEADAKAITTETPLESLKKIAINPDFASSAPQPSFVMDGTATVSRSGAGTTNDKAVGSVELIRAASRISFAVRVAESYTDSEGNEWTPNPDGISVLITKGVTRSQVESSSYTPLTGDYYATTTAGGDTHGARNFTKVETEDPTKGYPYHLDSPFYTFPNRWNPDEPESPMTYMTLMVPWRMEGTERYRTCYYMVPIVKGNQLVRNVAYTVKLNVDVLGSFTPDTPLPLDDLSYYAVPWGGVNMDVNLDESRYLVVDRNNFTMDNDSIISIPVYTSHETVITDIRMTYRRYYTNDDGDEVSIIVPKNIIDNSNSNQGTSPTARQLLKYNFVNVADGVSQATIDIKHELKIWEAYTSASSNTPIPQRRTGNGNGITSYINNDGVINNTNLIYKPTDNYAYSRYTIEVTIQHKDISEAGGNSFKEVLTIEQYPQMYIQADQNHVGDILIESGSSYWDPDIYSNSYAQYGNVYINNNQGSSDNSAWNNPSGLNGSNKNPNMYIIITTQLDENTKYIIGDPRSLTSRIPTESNPVSAPALYGDSPRTLQYYYPTGTDKDKYIAPEFRIASSWGVSPTMTKEQAEFRCATYQELNCPAGRWRLPTRSEFEYIIKQSDYEKIPELFNLSNNDLPASGGWGTQTQNGYWTAQGRVVQKPSQTDGEAKLSQYQSEASVRCVYDEWYWKGSTVTQNGTVGNTTVPKYPFTWGDRQRTN